MYKLLYWSINKDKLVVLMFSMFDDLMEYFYSVEDDVDMEKHFVKIVKENIKK